MRGHLAAIAILKANADVTAVTNRIYPLRRPNLTALPAIVVDLNDTEPHDNKSGVSKMDHDYIRVFIEGKEYDTDFIDLCDKVRSALDRYSGTINSVTVQSIQFRDEDSYDEEINNETVFVHEQEYKVITANG